MSDTAEDLLLRRSKRIFAVDRRTWNAVCDLGMNEAVCYLVIASGTGGDQRTSSWSANAIEKYMGIHHRRAKTAIRRLEEEKFVTVVRKGSLRRYSIQPACVVPAVIKKAGAGSRLNKVQQQEILDQLILPEWIWLPNSLIEGTAGEVPPVKILKQSQVINALRLFIGLYFYHDLPGSGGVEWRTGIGLRQPYKREKLGTYGIYNVWGFQPLPKQTFGNSPFWLSDFWDCLDIITDAGLLEFVTHLVENDSHDAEVLHPAPWGNGEDAESIITIYADKAGLKMVPFYSGSQMLLVPVPRLKPNVQLIGVARMKYRPHTAMTAEWLSRASEWREIADEFERLSGEKDDSDIKVVSK